MLLRIPIMLEIMPAYSNQPGPNLEAYRLVLFKILANYMLMVHACTHGTHAWFHQGA